MSCTRSTVWRALGAAVLLMALPAGAEEARPELVVHDYGVYVGRIEGHVPHEAMATGRLVITSGDTLVTRTDTICARLGVSFGLEYTIAGAPPGAHVEIELITRFPPPGLVNPSGRKFEQDRMVEPIAIGTRDLSLYMFEEPWEMVPGTWTFEFHHQGRKLGEKSFEVMTACPVT